MTTSILDRVRPSQENIEKHHPIKLVQRVGREVKKKILKHMTTSI